MDDGKRFYERPVFWPRLIGGIFLLSFVIAFRSEILLFLRCFKGNNPVPYLTAG